jgi:hypothetical protein
MHRAMTVGTRRHAARKAANVYVWLARSGHC